MIDIYAMAKGSRAIEEQTEIKEGYWINLENPSDKEIEDVAKKTKIPEGMLKAALDEEERAHIESEDGNTLIIVDIPVMNEEKDWYVYSTLPLAIIRNENFFVTVCLKDSSVLSDFIEGRIKNFDINKRTRFIYQLLYANATKFLHYLKQIDKTSTRIQQRLHKSMKNKELIQLLDLEKALVYFSTSLNSNQYVIDRIKSGIVKHFEEDNDILDDVIIENKQAIEMATIYRDIMSGTMDAFASVISNNQNTVMKLLTAITICLTIPTVIASLWGMNVIVPFENLGIWGFWIILGMIVVIIVPVIILMIKRKMF